MDDLKDDVRRYMDALATRVESVGFRPAAQARPPRRRALVLIAAGFVLVAGTAVAIVAWPADDRAQVSVGSQAPFEPPDGLTVVAGSQLVAPAIPAGAVGTFNSSPLIDDGYTALLEVQGNPIEVMGGYLDQATAQGMTLRQPAEVPETGNDEPPVRCQDQDDVFTCSAYARNSDPQHPRSMTMRFWRGQVDDARPMSHLELRYSTVSRYWENQVFPSGGSSDLAPPTVPDDITPSADATTMLANAEPIRLVQVAEGSRLVADLALPRFDGAEARAILQVTGEPNEVFERYAAQVGDITGEDTITRPSVNVPDGRLVQLSASEVGDGVSYDLALYEAGRQGTWISIRAGS